jgi:succinate-acetate transporter protein
VEVSFFFETMAPPAQFTHSDSIDTFAATAFASYGGFWISLGMIDSSNSPNSYGIIEGYGTNTKELNTALGFYLMA